MAFYWLTLGLLGVWRISHLFHAEDGPWDFFALLRQWAGSGFLGRLLDCFYCLSVWVAAPFALLLGGTWKERLFLWPALSAGAILLERMTTNKGDGRPSPAIYFEDAEDSDVLLRKEERTAPDDSSARPRS
jgi:hypothetical protein